MIAPMRIEWVAECWFYVVSFHDGRVLGNYPKLSAAEEAAITAHEAEEAAVAA